jgi:hypothetical protein
MVIHEWHPWHLMITKLVLFPNADTTDVTWIIRTKRGNLGERRI